MRRTLFAAPASALAATVRTVVRAEATNATAWQADVSRTDVTGDDELFDVTAQAGPDGKKLTVDVVNASGTPLVRAFPAHSYTSLRLG